MNQIDRNLRKIKALSYHTMMRDLRERMLKDHGEKISGQHLSMAFSSKRRDLVSMATRAIIASVGMQILEEKGLIKPTVNNEED